MDNQRPASRRIDFPNRQGESLAASLELPPDPPHAYAVFAHCFTCSKDIAAASRISGSLAAHGFGVLRFDFTGLGNSDGDFANTSFSSNVQDLVSAADHMREHFEAPALLIGHSLGGAAVLSAARHIAEVLGVVTIGAPADPEHITHLFDSAKSEIESEGSAEVTLAGRKFQIKKQFLDDLAQQDAGREIAKLRKAILIFHSPVDEIVDVDNARKIYEQALHPKSFVSLDRADHLLTRKEDSQYVASIISAWATRYI